MCSIIISYDVLMYLYNNLQVKCVLVAFDADLSYMKIMKAVRYLREVEGCHYIATNTDTALPMGERIRIPGN